MKVEADNRATTTPQSNAESYKPVDYLDTQTDGISSTKTTDSIQRDAAKSPPPPQLLEKPPVAEQHQKPDERARATPIPQKSEELKREPFTLKKADPEAGKEKGGLITPEVGR